MTWEIHYGDDPDSMFSARAVGDEVAKDIGVFFTCKPDQVFCQAWNRRKDWSEEKTYVFTEPPEVVTRRLIEGILLAKRQKTFPTKILLSHAKMNGWWDGSAGDFDYNNDEDFELPIYSEDHADIILQYLAIAIPQEYALFATDESPRLPPPQM